MHNRVILHSLRQRVAWCQNDWRTQDLLSCLYDLSHLRQVPPSSHQQLAATLKARVPEMDLLKVSRLFDICVTAKIYDLSLLDAASNRVVQLLNENEAAKQKEQEVQPLPSSRSGGGGGGSDGWEDDWYGPGGRKQPEASYAQQPPPPTAHEVYEVIQDSAWRALGRVLQCCSQMRYANDELIAVLVPCLLEGEGEPHLTKHMRGIVREYANVVQVSKRKAAAAASAPSSGGRDEEEGEGEGIPSATTATSVAPKAGQQLSPQQVSDLIHDCGKLRGDEGRKGCRERMEQLSGYDDAAFEALDHRTLIYLLRSHQQCLLPFGDALFLQLTRVLAKVLARQHLQEKDVVMLLKALRPPSSGHSDSSSPATAAKQKRIIKKHCRKVYDAVFASLREGGMPPLKWSSLALVIRAAKETEASGAGRDFVFGTLPKLVRSAVEESQKNSVHFDLPKFALSCQALKQLRPAMSYKVRTDMVSTLLDCWDREELMASNTAIHAGAADVFSALSNLAMGRPAMVRHVVRSFAASLYDPTSTTAPDIPKTGTFAALVNLLQLVELAERDVSLSNVPSSSESTTVNNSDNSTADEASSMEEEEGGACPTFTAEEDRRQLCNLATALIRTALTYRSEMTVEDATAVTLLGIRLKAIAPPQLQPFYEAVLKEPYVVVTEAKEAPPRGRVVARGKTNPSGDGTTGDATPSAEDPLAAPTLPMDVAMARKEALAAAAQCPVPLDIVETIEDGLIHAVRNPNGSVAPRGQQAQTIDPSSAASESATATATTKAQESPYMAASIANVGILTIPAHALADVLEIALRCPAALPYDIPGAGTAADAAARGLMHHWSSLSSSTYARCLLLLARLSLVDVSILVDVKEKILSWGEEHKYALPLSARSFETLLEAVTELRMLDGEVLLALRRIQTTAFPMSKFPNIEVRMKEMQANQSDD